MNAKLKALWLEALRSGEMKQTVETLKDGYGYCCLGVLCHVAWKNNMVPEPVEIDEDAKALVYRWKYEGGDDFGQEEDELPSGAFGLSDDILAGAVERNDGTGDFEAADQTFAQIADWIETAVPVDGEPT